jgi:hypothetical protein
MSNFAILARLGHVVCLLLAAAPLVLIGPGSARAAENSGIDPYAQVEFRAIQSDPNSDDGEELDSSGFGVGGEAGILLKPARQTRIRAEGNVSVFDYDEAARDTRTSYGGVVELNQALSREVEIGAYARRAENVAFLESSSANQSAVGASLQWEKDNDRLRFEGEYRARTYDTAAREQSDGYRLAAQYNRRFGPNQWLRVDVRHEDMESNDDPSRSHDRQSARIRYSLPVAPQLRVRPSVEYRQWSYDTRIAQGDPAGDTRQDHFVAPGVELAWGRDSRGPYAVAGTEYRIKSSNDTRYDNNTFRVSARLGYRF